MTWATSVPILVFLCFSVLDLGPMYVTDVRQTDRQTDRQTTDRCQTVSSLYAPPIRAGRNNGAHAALLALYYINDTREYS